MSLSEKEKQNIVALRMAKTKAIQKNKTSDKVQEKQIRKELTYYKQKLLGVCNQNDANIALEILEKLIRLHGELLQLVLQKIQGRYGYVSEALTKKLTRVFIQESHELTQLVLKHLYG